MLSEMQRRLAKAMLSQTESSDVALAGGAALICLELVDRTTRDLDFFSQDVPAVVVADAVEIVCLQLSFDVEPVTLTDTFRRYVVRSGSDECVVDLANDFRMLPAQRSELGKTLASEELAADKTLALLDRAAARDFIDVYALDQKFGRLQLFELAQSKDQGFDRDVFFEMIKRIERFDDEEFELDAARLTELKAFFANW